VLVWPAPFLLLLLSTALPLPEVESMTEPFPTRCLLHQVLYQRTSPYGDPYAVALMIDPAGNTHTALACSKLFGDLDKLSELEGQEVNLLHTRSGLKLRPWAEQSIEASDGCDETCCSSPSMEFDGLPDPLFAEEDPPASSTASSTGSAASALTDLATTVAKLARDLKLPTAMWIHLP
jgi:hypothetical protein